MYRFQNLETSERPSLLGVDGHFCRPREALFERNQTTAAAPKNLLKSRDEALLVINVNPR
jgi:hypothetical protein